MPTIPEIIDIAKLSQALANLDNGRSGLFGQRPDPLLPMKLYMERKAVEWCYDLDNTDSSLTETSNYLYSLCGRYGLTAQAIINGGTGGGAVVRPNSPYLIPITSADFASATAYNDPRIVGRNLAIFWNDIPRYIYAPTEFEYTTTGINILIDGFDATVNNYTLYIYIIN